MNKGHFKDSQVVKGITIGAVLIVIYLALNNVTYINSYSCGYCRCTFRGCA